MSIRANKPWESPPRNTVAPQQASKQTSSRFLQTILALIVFAALGYFILGLRPQHTTTPVASNEIVYNYSAGDSLTLWSSDFHISPIADVKHLLKPYKVSIIDKSLSGHCHLTDTCERDLRVITKLNGIHLRPCANKLRKEFYDSYRLDPVMSTVDAFICTHAASMCELFMPFNKPMIVIASTRYEIGRLDAVSWQRWNDNLRAIAASPYNTIAANNKYDQEYIRYFTGIQDVVLLPNFCNYVNARYAPTRPEILLGPARGVNPGIQQQMFTALESYNKHMTVNPENTAESSNHKSGADSKTTLKISPIRDVYAHFEYTDLAAHPAMVILPYQVSFMSLFEFYRMQIPLFAPSPALLTQWHVDHKMLNERTWMSVLGQPQLRSILGRHTDIPHNSSVPKSDPNDEFTHDAILEWVKLADFYQWPHIAVFDTWEQLFAQLGDKSQLHTISAQMGAYNVQEETQIKSKWLKMLNKIQARKVHRKQAFSQAARGDSNNPSQVASENTIKDMVLPVDVNDALQQQYGYTLSATDCNLQVPSAAGSRSQQSYLRQGGK